MIENTSEIGKKINSRTCDVISSALHRSKIETAYCHLHGGIGDVLYAMQYVIWLTKMMPTCHFKLIIALPFSEINEDFFNLFNLPKDRISIIIK